MKEIPEDLSDTDSIPATSQHSGGKGKPTAEKVRDSPRLQSYCLLEFPIFLLLSCCTGKLLLCSVFFVLVHWAGNGKPTAERPAVCG